MMLPALVILFILGLSIGSFLNACAYRVPRRISVVTFASACPACQAKLTWWELIPLLSFTFQLGRCRSCGNKISWRYPLYEIIVAAGLIMLFQVFGATEEFWLKGCMFLLMSLICVVDWEFQIIPNKVLIVGAVAGIALKGFLDYSVLPQAIISAFLAFATAFAIHAGANLVFHRQSLGMGDVKLAWVLGLFLGLELFLVTFWVASLIGMIYGLLRKKELKADPLPFGSFLAVSSVVVFVFDEPSHKLFSIWS